MPKEFFPIKSNKKKKMRTAFIELEIKIWTKRCKSASVDIDRNDFDARMTDFEQKKTRRITFLKERARRCGKYCLKK